MPNRTRKRTRSGWRKSKRGTCSTTAFTGREAADRESREAVRGRAETGRGSSGCGEIGALGRQPHQIQSASKQLEAIRTSSPKCFTKLRKRAPRAAPTAAQRNARPKEGSGPGDVIDAEYVDMDESKKPN